MFAQRSAQLGVGGAARRNFVVGPENAILSDVFARLLEGRHGPYNPLILYGPPGVGKSHLGRGLALDWHRRDPDSTVLYQSAADLLSEYAEAVEFQAFDAFRSRYAELSLWVLDDLDHLTGKTGTQHELVRLLDDLLASGGQFVGTLRNSLQSLDGWLPGLRGRLSAGLAVPLARPSPQTRLALVQQMSLDCGIALGPLAAENLAAGMTGTARELAGALMFLETATRLEGRTISALDAEAFVANQSHRAPPELAKIAAMVARQFALKTAQLKSASRSQTIVLARSLAMHLTRELTDNSLEHIGRWFGGRDHSTVLHACRKIATALEVDEELARIAGELRRKLVAE